MIIFLEYESLIQPNFDMYVTIAYFCLCVGSHPIYIYVICVCLRTVVSNKSWLYEWNGGYLRRGRNYLPFATIWVHPRCLVGLLIFLVFCVVFCFSSSFVLCTQCCQFFFFLHCSFLIVPLVFSNVYLLTSPFFVDTHSPFLEFCLSSFHLFGLCRLCVICYKIPLKYPDLYIYLCIFI